MPTAVQGQQVLRATHGFLVSRGTAALPQTTIGSIFTVTGGRIIIVSLVGEVTTVLGAGVNAVSIGNTPSGGASAPTTLGTATSVATAAVGTIIGANAGGAVIVSVSGTALTPKYLMDAGAITITTTGSVTGSVKWDLVYVPHDPGATVVAA